MVRFRVGVRKRSAVRPIVNLAAVFHWIRRDGCERRRGTGGSNVESLKSLGFETDDNAFGSLWITRTINADVYRYIWRPKSCFKMLKCANLTTLFDYTFGSSKEYTYDANGWLTQVREITPVMDGTEDETVTSYTYDSVGNRITKTDDEGTMTSAYNGLHQLVSTQLTDEGTTVPVSRYTYDDNVYEIPWVHSVSRNIRIRARSTPRRHLLRCLSAC